jgi:hypothetical protein
MDQEQPRHDVAKKRLVSRPPSPETVRVRRDVPYRDDGSADLTMDIYTPAVSGGSPLPAVVFVIGFSDRGARPIFGCAFKEWQSYVDWARLVASAGIVAVTYSTGDRPEEDLPELLRHVRENAGALGVDAERIGIWACSGHGPTALSALMNGENASPACAVLCYPFTLDLDGSTSVADAQKTWRFANPTAGRSVDDIREGTPLLLVRAGRDEMPGLNDALDRFTAQALARDLPLTLVNHAGAPHAFDVAHDTDSSRKVIDGIVRFLRCHLSR